MHLVELLLVVGLGDLGEELDHALDDDTLELPEELVRLQSFARDVQREVISYNRADNIELLSFL